MRVLLTGASGFLGQELVRSLAAYGHSVYAGYCTSRRQPRLLATWLKCDVTQHDLALAITPNVDIVVHNAALVSFRKKRAREIYTVNSKGTLNVWLWCLRHHVRKLALVSTAYMCGDWASEWTERDFNRGQHFRNPYEHSKFLAEAYVRELSYDLAPVQVQIFRPGIIAGRSDNGEAHGFEGFYKPVAALARVSAAVERGLGLPARTRAQGFLHLPKLPIPIVIKGNPKSTLNLVPVDWVADRIASMLGGPEGTYHLTSSNPPTNAEVVELIGSVLGVQGFHINPHARLLQPHDRLYALMTRDYAPYLEHEASFQSSVRPPAPEWRVWLRRAIEYWQEHHEEVSDGEHSRSLGEAGRATVS